MAKEEKVECRTPTPNKKPTRISKAKFDLLRRAILRVTPANGDGIAFADLFKTVEDELTPKELDGIGSLAWYVTTVKLELEVRGELVRVPGKSPQRLRREKVRR